MARYQLPADILLKTLTFVLAPKITLFLIRPLTLTLIVVMALGLAAPALAYTNIPEPEAGSSPYIVEIILVEHGGAGLVGTSLNYPETDRGYAKNEIVAAVGKLTIPTGLDIYADGYRQLRFTPKNVSLYVTDNKINASNVATLETNLPATSSLVTVGVWPWWTYNSTPERITHGIGAAGGSGEIPVLTTGDRKLNFLIYGKVLDDDASISFQLRRNAAFAPTAAAVVTLVDADLDDILGGTYAAAGVLTLNSDFVVFAELANAITGVPNNPNTWYVYENTVGLGYIGGTGGTALPGDLRFIIETDKASGRTSALYMFPDGAAGFGYRIHVEPSTQQLVFIKYSDGNSALLTSYDQVKYGSAGYASLRAFYDEEFEGTLGFSAYNEGNLLKGSDWETIAAAAIDISDTVDIEPWTAYVKVPENIVVDPPKTGEAASAAGFITLLLAAAAMVVVKKVRA